MKKNLILFLTLLSFAGLVSCNSTPEKGTTAEDANATAPVAAVDSFPPSGTLSGDSIFVSGRYVLFFGTDEQIKDPAEQAAITQFKETAAAVIDSINRQGNLQATYCVVNHIVVNNRGNSRMVISRTYFKEKTGIILMDGNQPPEIRKGVLTAPEYHAALAKFFMTNVNS
ncbi:MAG: hypothetical protein JNL49_11985 [Bacteroidia bacterium]|nr:hypothetical protein [Bacteroidia bacterium]